MFNKNIYQVWFQGCDKLEKPEYVQNVTNWRLLNPDWKYFCASDSDLRKACATYSPECLATYDKFDVMHLKIDFGRYVLLYLNGGIYVDMDAYVLRSLNSSHEITELIQKCADGLHVLGLSTVNVSMYESMAFIGHKKFINNAIMLSSPHNPLLRAFIDETIQISNTKFDNNYTKVTNITGPIHVNTFFQKYVAEKPPGNYIKLFSPEVFEPCKLNDCNITKNTVALHEMELTWLPEDVRAIHNFYFNFRMYIPLLFIVPVIYLLIRLRYRKCKKLI